MKSRAVLHSFLFSVVLMIFPVLSGAIVAINHMGAPQSYWVQGSFMLASVVVPMIVLLISKTPLSQIGFAQAEKGGIKTALYFLPLLAAKIGFLFFGIEKNMEMILALAFFTAAIGLSEEIYFRGVILKQLTAQFSLRQAVLLSSAFFAAVHISQAFSGAGFLLVVLTVANALVFGIVAAEIVILTGSLIPVILWHALYDFVNWTAPVQGTTEILLTVVQTVIMIAYGIYLWTKLPEKYVKTAL
ncbi:MAG TPA: CPBP family intramembrane glutamic endopeptidase [Clostridia bacterium]|nr:CPBP family intramembrane glutamic endopeptidase [Clostridia bacterium]